MDDTPVLSVEDKRFIATMDRDMIKNNDGYWVAPLPFREEVKSLPNSHEEVLRQKLATPRPCWYLPHFGVCHPQKPEKIRVVFDSASEVKGVSLNKLLLSVPDLANSLLGVLLRFRRNEL